MAIVDDFSAAQTAYREAGVAFRAGNYSQAIDRLLEAQSYLAAVPDSHSASGMRLMFGRQIDGLLAQARASQQRADAASVSGGIQRANIEYTNPDC